MDLRCFEAKVKASVFRDIAQALLDAGHINQSLYDFWDEYIQEMENRMIANADRSSAPSREVTVKEPKESACG